MELSSQPIKINQWMLAACKSFNLTPTEFWNMPLFALSGFFRSQITSEHSAGNRKMMVDKMRAAKKLFGWV